VPVHRPGVDELLQGAGGESSAVVAARIAEARLTAHERNGSLNAAIPAALLDAFAPLEPKAQKLLRAELEHDRLTGRGYHRVRRVARTLADLDEDCNELVLEKHVAMALQFRVRLSPLLRGRAA
jgi:magnesium chelatase family protein